MPWFQELLAKAPLLTGKAKSQSKDLTKAWEATSPEDRKKAYDKARRSILGDLPTSADGEVVGCPVVDKKGRREERKALIANAAECCPELKDAAERLRRDMDEVENMRCAKQVYLDNDPDAPDDLRNNCPPGFRRPTEDELAGMGLTPEILQDGEFRAAVYMKDPAVWGDDPKPAAVIAFRGSTRAQEDWDNNFAQNANKESAYYKRAVQIGNRLRLTGADVQIVGHSLGGGLASAAEGGSGLPTSTYNAAGLHPETVKRYTLDADRVAADPDKINAIRVRGEVLTKTQEKGLLSLGANKAVGKKRTLDPATGEDDWKRQRAPGNEDDYSTYLHGMDEVIAAMEKSKQNDEKALRACGSK